MKIAFLQFSCHRQHTIPKQGTVKYLFNFSIGFVFLLCTTPTLALPPNATSLHQELHQFLAQNFDTDDIENAELTALQQFYAAHGYKPAWTHSDQQLSQLTTVLNFIATAEDEGLDSNDYQLQQLMQLVADRSSIPDYELEFQTTWSLQRFARDLFRGRFTASQMDPDWHIPQPDFDSVSFLLKALSSEDLQQSLESLTPTIPSYQLLKKTLAKFRDLAARGVSWTHIPNLSLLHPGVTHQAVPLIRARIAEAYETHGLTEYNLSSSPQNPNSTYYDSDLVNAVKAFQLQHGLNADGIIGKNTLNALNKTPADKVKQLRINMERLRWLPRQLGDRYLLVNIAGFQLAAIENGENILDMRIIVGRNYRSTPSFQSHITHIILNPFWNVPASIARKDLLPKQQKDPGYFNEQNIKVYSNYTYSSEPIDPDTIDWKAIKNGFPYALRQEPGEQNALGSIKFMLPNQFNIYLHDTPSKTLFNKDIRTFSSGCIRLEKPLLLADFALQGHVSSVALKQQIDSGKTTQINLPESLPTYIVYLTTWIDGEHNIHYSPDTYGRDERGSNFAHW